MRILAGRSIAIACGLGLLAVVSAGAQPPPTKPPVPKPFPGATAPPTAEQPPGATLEGAPVYPAAEFLDSFDAGRGQRLYVYGTNADFASIVAYYQSVLSTRGRELFKAPAMRQFDLGRFDDDTMLLQPSVVVKDYTWNGSEGYLVLDGTTEKRFKTIIQIVPAPGQDGGGLPPPL